MIGVWAPHEPCNLSKWLLCGACLAKLALCAKQTPRTGTELCLLQDFMNGVATNIIHLQHKKLKYYGGALLTTCNPHQTAIQHRFTYMQVVNDSPHPANCFSIVNKLVWCSSN